MSRVDVAPASTSAIEHAHVAGPQKLTLRKELLFSVGQLGWSTVQQLVGIQLVYFYIPPDDVAQCSGTNQTKHADPIFPQYVTDQRFAVVLNVVVILASAGRFFDAITDPLVATFSDNLRTSRGRRIPCLAIGALPCAASAALLFFPPIDRVSGWNIVWLAVLQIAFYASLTLYCTPYFAMIPELGRTEQQRLDLSMWTSMAFAVGSVLAGSAPVIGGLFTSEALGAIRVGICVICLVGALCMYVPVFTIDEPRYCAAPQKSEPLFAALRHCSCNRHFRPYVAADFAFFFAIAMIQTGMPFYVTVLLCLPIDVLTAVLGGLVALSLAFNYPVNVATRRFGKKRLVLVAMVMMAVLFSMLFFAGERLTWLLPIWVQVLLVPLFGAWPICVLGMLPNAILADITFHDSLVSGTSNEGIYFAARTFLQKIGVTMGIFVFASLTNFGNSPGDDLGVRLSGPTCVVVLIAAAIAFSFYREDELTREIAMAQHATGVGKGCAPASAGASSGSCACA